MTPLMIKMVLHYYALAEPYANDDLVVVIEQRKLLMTIGLIYYDPTSLSDYHTTTYGDRYVKQLCAFTPWKTNNDHQPNTKTTHSI